MRKILALGTILLLMLVWVADALGAVTVTVNSKKYVSIGNYRGTIADISLSGTYATDGVSLAANKLGLKKIEKFIIMSETGYMAEYDYTNSKIVLYNPQPTITLDSVVSGTCYYDTVSLTDYTPVYVATHDGVFGWLTATVSDNADTHALIGTAKIPVHDSDSPDSVVALSVNQTSIMTFDDSNNAANLMFTTNNAWMASTMYVPTTTGEYLAIGHAASGDTTLYLQDTTCLWLGDIWADADVTVTTSGYTAFPPNSVATAVGTEAASGVAISLANIIVLVIGY